MTELPKKQGVVAVLTDADGRYLVIRRGLSLKRAPGWWCLPGGEVEAGESLHAAVEREVLEELNLRVKAGAKLHESISPNAEYLLHWFDVQLCGVMGDLRAHEVEVAEARWLSAREIEALPQVLPGLLNWLKSRAGAG